MNSQRSGRCGSPRREARRRRAVRRLTGRIPALLVLLAGCGGSGGSTGSFSASLDLGTAVWGSLRGGTLNQGRGQAEGPAEGRVAWATAFGGPIESAITIDGAGNLRVRPTGSELYALRPDGSVLWQRNVGPGVSTPVVDRYGAVFISNTNGNVMKVDVNGKQLWKVGIGSDPGTGLPIGGGKVVYAAPSGTVTVVAGGVVLQTLSVGGVANSAPVSTSDTQAFVASTDGNLYELQIDPTTKDLAVGESLALPGPVTNCTPAAAGGNVYVVTDNDVLVKTFNDRFTDDDAGISWTFDPLSGTSTGGKSSPAIGRDFTIYYGTQDGRMLAVDVNGNQLWSVNVGAAISSSVLLDRSDNLYFRSVDGWFHSLTKTGQVRFVRRRSDPLAANLDCSPSLTADGSVLIGTQSGAVLSLGGGPVFGQLGQDATHRGVSGAEGPRDAGLVWSVDVGAALKSTPLVLEDGSVALHDVNGLLHFLSPQGRVSFTAGLGGFAAKLALGRSGLIYATTSDGRLRGYQRSGGIAFTTSLGGVLTAPTVATDGTLRVASALGEVFWLDANGTITHQVAGPSVTGPPPAVDGEGDTYVVGAGGRLVRYDRDGLQTGSFKLPGGVSRSVPVVAGDGTVYVATNRDVLVAVGPDFVGRWTFDPQESKAKGGAGGPALGPSNTVVHVTQSGVLHGRDVSSGARRFELNLGAPATESPVTDLEGRIYVTTTDGRVHIADVSGVLWQTIATTALDGSAFHHGARLVDDEGLVVASDAGRATLLRPTPPWFGFHGTPEHTGRSVKNGPVAPGSVDWSVNVGGSMVLSPVVAADGNVLVHTSQGSLVVVSSGGGIVHTLPAGPGPGLPLAHPSGLMVVGSGGGVLSAFDTSGNAAWFVTLGGSVSGLGLGPGGEILAASLGQLRAVDPCGNVLWNTAAGTNGEGAPAAGADGILRVANAEGELRRFDEDGDPLGTTALGGAARHTSPLVGSDGRTYVVTDGDVLVAVEPDGTVAWSFDPLSGASQGGRASPCLAHNGDVVYGAMDGFVYRVSAAGTQVYAFDTGAPVRSAPVLDGADITYVGSTNGLLYALEPDGDPVFTFDPSGGSPSALTSPAFATDGSLYVGSSSGVLYRVR